MINPDFFNLLHNIQSFQPSLTPFPLFQRPPILRHSPPQSPQITANINWVPNSQPKKFSAFSIDALLSKGDSEPYSVCKSKKPEYRHNIRSTPYPQINLSENPPKNSASHYAASSNSQSPGGGKASKSKRIRTIFTAEQLEKLELEFKNQQYMVGPERVYLAQTLNLTEAQVKVWFQNRRIKWRKQYVERRPPAQYPSEVLNDSRECDSSSSESHERKEDHPSPSKSEDQSPSPSSECSPPPSPDHSILVNTNVSSGPAVNFNVPYDSYPPYPYNHHKEDKELLSDSLFSVHQQILKAHNTLLSDCSDSSRE